MKDSIVEVFYCIALSLIAASAIAIAFASFNQCHAATLGGNMSGEHGHRAGYAQPAPSRGQTGQGKPWSVQATEYDPNSIDRFQPWPQAEMKQYQRK